MSKERRKKPVVAICYDFDKNAVSDDMQAQGFIQKLGMKLVIFWKKSNGLLSKMTWIRIFAYMFTMKTESAGKVLFTKTS